MQIFCFTHAGGYARFYNNLETEAPNLSFEKIEYSGHGKRAKEPLCTNINEMVDDVYKMFVDRYKGGSYSMMGYSMGCIVMTELLSRIVISKTISNPESVFIAACSPISRIGLSEKLSDEMDQWIENRIRQYGQVPNNDLMERMFWKMYMPLYRADYSIIRNYDFEKLQLRTEIPLTVFYSEDDTPRHRIEEWKRYFIGICDYYQFEGGHFFINEYYKEIAKIIELKTNTT